MLQGKCPFKCSSKTETSSEVLGILWRNVLPFQQQTLVESHTYIHAHKHIPSLSLTGLIRVREGCGQSARCLSCLGEQTGSCLSWRGDQSWGCILRGRAKVAVVRTLMPCCARQLGDLEYTQYRGSRQVCMHLFVCVLVQAHWLPHHTLLLLSNTDSLQPWHTAVVWETRLQNRNRADS